MPIQLEASETNSIRSYTDTNITVGQMVYQHSVIISKDSIISPWTILSINDINETTLAPALRLQPDIIIIGQSELSQQLPIAIMAYLSQQRVGIECMSIGSACRTFNLLLSEQRRVVAGIILAS